MESPSFHRHTGLRPGTLNILDVEQERALAKQKDLGDLEARDRLVFSCLRLVMHIAKKYQHRGLPWIDLVQEGALGLLRAVDKFDWQHKTRLTTYATPWIQQAIRRALTQQVSLIRLPERIQAEVWNLTSTAAALTQSLGREPTEAEVATHTGISLNRINKLQLWHLITKRDISHELVSEDFDERERPLEELDVDERLDRQNQYELLQQCFSQLDEEEQQILSARFGLEDGETQTLVQVGRALGYSYEKTRSIEGRALHKLRHAIAERSSD